MQTGIIYAFFAYVMWGVFPFYFKALHTIAPFEILLNRVVWAFVFLAAIMVIRGKWSWLGRALGQPRVLAGFAASAMLLSVNWFFYIWGVNNGHIVECSLGYFINPLVNVLLGALVLREKLRRWQWAAVSMAAAGVIWLTWQTGGLPWVALILALSFAAYGLLRKTAALGALEGLMLETAWLFPFALIAMLVLAHDGRSSFAEADDGMRWLLAASGPITAAPLLLFAAGARRIPFSLVGLLQYISPSLQLLLGVMVYGETLGGAKLVGFALIWSALVMYSLESIIFSQRNSQRDGQPALAAVSTATK